MADIERLKVALVNADKAGDVEAARTLASEIRKMMAAKPKAVDTMDPAQFDPTAGTGFGQRMLEGVGAGLNSVKQALTFAPKAEVDATEKLNAPLMRTGGGAVGNVAGQIAAAAPAAFIPGANTVLGAGLIGAGAGALMTPGDVNDRLTGAALGGAGGAAGQLIPKALRVAKAAAEPFSDAGRNAIIGRVMNRAAGDNAGAIAQRLRGAKELVPGSAPTAAEVAESGGIASLQRAMSAADPEAYAHRGMQQASARVQALRGIAGDEASRNSALAARSAATDPLYAAAKAANVTPDADLYKIIERLPKGTIERAGDLARQMGKSGDMSTGEQLHFLKLAVDAALDSNPANAISKVEKGAIKSVKDDLLNWMGKAIPEYDQARTTFSAMSRPVNQMDVGKALLDKMQGPLSDHGGLASETASRFANALRNEGESVARSATGFRQGLADVLDPAQMDTVSAIAQDLARKSNAQNLGRGPGSNTFQNFAMDNLAAEGGMPTAVKALSGFIPGMSPMATLASKAAGAGANLAYKTQDEVMRKMMAQALLNPQQAATLMEAAGKPALLVRALQNLPASVQKRIPPEDVLKLMQAAPGITGAAALPAYLHQ